MMIMVMMEEAILTHEFAARKPTLRLMILICCLPKCNSAFANLQ